MDSVPLHVTGDHNNLYSEDTALKKLEISDNSNMNIEKLNEFMIKYNDLPYDPFDYETTPMNYEVAKNDYEGFIRKCPLYLQYQEYKSKRSLNRKIET